MDNIAATLNQSLLTLFNGLGQHRFESRETQRVPVYESTFEISCHMGFFDMAGKTAGVALLNIDRKDLLEMWSRIWQLPPSEESEATEIAKELTNMIVANASAQFAEAGLRLRVSLPQIIECGHTIKLSTMKRDNFHYYEFSEGDVRFHWVICSYEVIEFA